MKSIDLIEMAELSSNRIHLASTPVITGSRLEDNFSSQVTNRERRY